MKNNRYKILILDDQLESMYNIMTTLEQIAYVDIKYKESDVKSARHILEKQDVDILFLDVMMPEVDGFTFLGFLKDIPATIICSASGKSAYEAFDHEVIDYISKLAPRKRIEHALMKAINHLEKQKEDRKSEEAAIGLTRVSDNKMVQINWRDIAYVSIQDYILTVNFIEAKKEEYHCSLSSFLDKVPPKEFIRIHRSFVVKVDFIRYRKYKKLVLWNWEELPIGFTYYNELDKRIQRSKS